MNEQVFKELERIARLSNLSRRDFAYVIAHLPDLLAEIQRLRQYEKAWSDYQVWLKRDSGEVRRREAGIDRHD